MADMELILLKSSDLCFKTLLLFTECFEGSYNFFHLVFLILDEALEIFVFLLQLLPVLLPVNLILASVCDLAVFDLD